MADSAITINTSKMPLQLRDTSSRQKITYSQRLAPYYSHLSRLVAQELEANIIDSSRRMPLVPQMGNVFQAVLLHALDYPDKTTFDKHPQYTLMQRLIQDTFGVRYEGSQYLDCIYAIGESFWDRPEELEDAAKRKLAALSYSFAERITTLVRASTNSDADVLNEPAFNLRVLPFMKYLWAGKFEVPAYEPKHIQIARPRAWEPNLHKHVLAPGRHEITVPRDFSGIQDLPPLHISAAGK